MSVLDFNDDGDVSPSLSRFIAGLIGPALLAISASMLLNRELGVEIAFEITHSKGLILLSGVSLLVAGLAIVQCHATWRGWPAIITALGWLSIVSGLGRTLFPMELAAVAPALTAPMFVMMAALVCLGLGGFLTVKAYL
jgi:hypothetical protein